MPPEVQGKIFFDLVLKKESIYRLIGILRAMVINNHWLNYIVYPANKLYTLFQKLLDWIENVQKFEDIGKNEKEVLFYFFTF